MAQEIEAARPEAILRDLVEAALTPFIQKAVERAEPASVPGLWEEFRRHSQSVLAYCVERGLLQPRLDEAFIQGLHSQLYPGQQTLPLKLPDGRVQQLVPGAYRTLPCSCRIVLVPGMKTWFLAPERIPQAMVDLVQQFNESGPRPLSPGQADTLRLGFLSTFMQIHPFPDGNLRTAMLLVDFLAVKAGHAPRQLSRIRAADPKRFQAALERSQRAQRPTPLQKYLDEAGAALAAT